MLKKYYLSAIVNCVPKYMIRLRKPAPKPSQFEAERIEHKHIMNKFRSNLVKEYWEDQRKLENEYIDNYLEKEKQKQKRLEVYGRSQVVIQTYLATQQHKKQEEKKNKREERIKKYMIEQDIKKMNRKQILSMLNEESKSWINSENINQVLTGQLLIPDTVTDEITYYNDLEEQAIMYENAQFDKLDEYSDVNKILEYKNRLGMPLYQRIVSLIKFLRQENPIYKLQYDWEVCRSILLKDKQLNDQELTNQLDKIDTAFKSLKESLIEELESNSVKTLHELNKQLIRLYNLLELWDKYITIVKMDNSTAQMIIEKDKDEFNLFNGQTKSDVKENKIFEDEFQKEGYMSADEKHTDSDEDIDLESLSQKTKQQQQQQQQQQQNNEKPQEFDSSLLQTQLSSGYGQTIEQLLEQASKEDTRIKFEDLYNKQSLEKVLYNPNLTQTSVDSRSVFEGIDLENIFPQEILMTKREPFLQFKDINDIEEQHERLKAIFSLRTSEDNIEDPDMKKLNTTIMATAYKKLLNGLNVPESHHQLLKDTIKLVEAVGEQKIQEPKFLLQVWNYYK